MTEEELKELLCQFAVLSHGLASLSDDIGRGLVDAKRASKTVKTMYRAAGELEEFAQ